MNQLKLNFSFRMITVLAVCVLGGSIASAQADRTWVSPSGDDANNCSVTKPCHTFAGALAKTNSGGQIVVKNSGAFGPVTIDRSITIDGAGKYAGIQVPSGGNGVTIQAANTDVIVLRGLTIKGLGVGSRGISVTSFGGVLHVENCAISDFTFDGIFGGGALTLFVHDTVISECASRAINMYSGGRALIEHTRLENNGTGLYLLLGAQVTVLSSVASGNAHSGFETDWGILNLENCVASNNGTGVIANMAPSPTGPTIVVISNTVVTNNQTGLRQTCNSCGNATSVMYSRGNNTVTGNNTDISGTITPLGGS